MARKKSAPNLPEATLNRARRAAGHEVEASPRQQKARAAQASGQMTSRRISMDDLVGEYSYVLTDLRSMGLLAAALFVVLIVLSFLL